MAKQRLRRYIGVLLIVVAASASLWQHEALWQAKPVVETTEVAKHNEAQPGAAPEVLSGGAAEALATLAVKGRAPKTDYARAQFGDGWARQGQCDMRNSILKRDMTDVVEQDCKVMSGTLQDPYTGKTIRFIRGPQTSPLVQIDHVVALSDAWQKGAQVLSREQRIALSNDPLNLLAVDGPANQAKSDGDAATWLPEYKPFRCQYVARQVAVKVTYDLWVTAAERDAMARVLATCPGQRLPTAG